MAPFKPGGVIDTRPGGPNGVPAIGQALIIPPVALSPGRHLPHTIRMNTTRVSGREDGATLLEACAALALASALSGALLAGLRPLSCAVRVQAARNTLTGALLEARREAYAREGSVAVHAAAGDPALLLSWNGARRALGDGVTVLSGPADGSVQFRASGLADNATVTLGCSASTASVVVNQRGVIR